MNLKTVCLTGAIALPSAILLAAATPRCQTVSIAAEYVIKVVSDSSTQPHIVTLSAGGTADTFAPDPDTGVEYVMKAPLDPHILIREGVITVTYTDLTQQSLPVRLLFDHPAFLYRFHRNASLSCLSAVVRRVSQSSQDWQINLVSYFDAETLVQNSLCGSELARQVVEAQYERSVDLSKESVHFALDQTASKTFLTDFPRGASRVQAAIDQSSGVSVQVAYDDELTAIHSGNFAVASHINASLSEGITSDPQLKRGADLQGVDIGRLHEDRVYIETLEKGHGLTP